uniref:ADP-ribosylation factor-like protein 2-binding protein n=1 Tax=Neobodo designis TaxID=312471 RepID=A0A7S1QNV7_NEODS|mmetsp:Transcript_49528/g.152849  ORF Transcript_49528/g.152849 Transcript_49528/m.152849 type:complete len:170 (+) Transcript_49528:171-680(+)
MAQQPPQQNGPVVMDALELLGLQGGGGDGDNDGLDDEGEEVFACDNTGTAADRDFDAVIGVIEDVMVSPAFRATLDAAVADCPPFASLNDHERYQCHKQFLSRIEAHVDEGVARAVPHLSTEEIARLVKEREAEVSDDVFDLVNGACLSYQQFAALWQERDKAAAEKDA